MQKNRQSARLGGCVGSLCKSTPLFPFRGQTLYNASKAANKLFTEGLYTELSDLPVKVTVVFPGAIDTNIIKNSNVAMNITKAKGNLAFSPLSPAKAAQKNHPYHGTR